MAYKLSVYILLIITSVIVLSCAGKKEVIGLAEKTGVTKRDLYSELVINYKLDKSGIKDTFNNAIAEVFKGNFDIPDYDIKLLLSKPKDAAVEIEGKNILVVVPVAIQVEKQTFLANLKAKGTLEMSFITEVDVDSLWNVKTKTSLSYHRWIEKPKLSVAGLNLPIETISNTVISRSKGQIEQSIDDSVKESFTLRQKMKETMKIFDQPMQMDPAINAWLNITPERMLLNKIINGRFSSQGKIGIKALSSFTTYKPASHSASNNLPKVYWSETMPDSSVFRLVTDIKMMDINAMIKSNLDGKTFSSGEKKITLSNIITNCDYEYLKVVTDVAGTVNGTLIIKGKPRYDAISNSFHIENIDIQLKTKNVIHKAAAWIGEGKIRKEIETMLKFSIAENISAVQQNINEQIAAMNKKYNLEMKLGIGKIDIESFELKPGQIEALMRSTFYLEVGIKDFRTFSKF